MIATEKTVTAMTDMPDSAEFPSPHLRAMVIRLRIEMLTAVKALRGELRDEIWKLVDELNALRAAQARDRTVP